MRKKTIPTYKNNIRFNCLYSRERSRCSCDLLGIATNVPIREEKP